MIVNRAAPELRDQIRSPYDETIVPIIAPKKASWKIGAGRPRPDGPRR
jgi:hypothetical protein